MVQKSAKNYKSTSIYLQMHINPKMCKISAMHKISANLEIIRKSAKNLQICSKLCVVISIKTKICKKSVNQQKIIESAKNLKIHKKCKCDRKYGKFTKKHHTNLSCLYFFARNGEIP